MASISAESFEFVRGLGSNGLVQMRVKTRSRGFYYINTYTGYATKPRPAPHNGKNPQVRLPKRMAIAMTHACWLFDQQNQHMRQKWRPRWPA